MEISKKNGKINKSSSKKSLPTMSSKNEVSRQAKKIFETILTGYVRLTTCVQTAHDIYLLFPEHFENEMFQLCLEYLKKGLVNTDDSKNNLTTTCITIGKYIGKLYCADVFKSETIKSTMSLLSKFEQGELSKAIHDEILNSIYYKVMNNNDEVLKSFFPNNFERITSDGEISSDESFVGSPIKKTKEEEKRKVEEKRPASTTSTSTTTTSVTIGLSISPINKFKVNKIITIN